MKICMIGAHCCVRIQKMAIPLIERGHEVHLIGMKVPSFWEQYATFTLCTDVKQVLNAVQIFKDQVDLFHCHNEPSWFVTAVKEITDTPVILDVHDSYIGRSTVEETLADREEGKVHLREMTEERNNFQLADALVFPGEMFADSVTEEYGLDQPRLVLPSYLPERFLQYHTEDWYGGLVYEGKVVLPKELEQTKLAGFKYCDYTDMAERTEKLGMDFHLYANRSGDEPFMDHYNSDHTFCHKGVHYEKLLGSISRHDWGLVGNSTKSREWDVAMPNKLFEYIAACVPVVVMNAASSAEFIKKTGMGIVVDGPEELADRWAEHRECRKTVIRKRKQWTMNAHIHELEDFYEKVLRVDPNKFYPHDAIDELIGSKTNDEK